MPTILITGMSGFVGGAAAKAFRENGWTVRGVGRRQLNEPGYFSLDLANPLSSEFKKIISTSDVVLHAAARSSPWGRRSQFISDNVTATANLLKACEQNGKPRFVFVSSSSVFYQNQDQFGIDEATPFAQPAVNHYAHSKQVAEQAVRAYSGEWITVRPRAVYGVGDTVLFPRILAAAQAGKLPLLIRNGDPAVGDLISIENLVEYLVESASSSVVGEFNLTDNQPQQIIGFLLKVFDRLGIDHPRKQLSVKTAFRIAWILEMVYGGLMLRKEPPITRFGVHVFAFSKTFNVEKMISSFGSPKYSTEESVERFVEWVKETDPYQLDTNVPKTHA